MMTLSQKYASYEAAAQMGYTPNLTSGYPGFEPDKERHFESTEKALEAVDEYGRPFWAVYDSGLEKYVLLW